MQQMTAPVSSPLAGKDIWDERVIQQAAGEAMGLGILTFIRKKMVLGAWIGSSLERKVKRC